MVELGEYRAHSAGVAPWVVRPNYRTYISPYGPRYKIQPNINGWTLKAATKLGFTLAGFGATAGFFALFFFGEVPRVRHDILSKVPLIGHKFIREIPASDNPF